MALRPPRVPLLAVAPLLAAGLLVSQTASAQPDRGAGLTVQAAALLGLDFLAERRAQRYMNAIVDFNPTAARGSTFGLTLGGTF